MQIDSAAFWSSFYHDVSQAVGEIGLVAGTHQQLFVHTLDGAAGQFDVGIAHGQRGLLKGEAVGAQVLFAKSDFNLFFREAAEIHFRDAVYGEQVVLYLAGVALEGAQIHIAGKGVTDGKADVLLPENDGRLHAGRERADAVHRVFHVLQDEIGLIALEHLNRDRSAVFLRYRGILFYASDALEVLLDFLDHAFFHFFGRCPGIDDLDLDKAAFHFREESGLHVQQAYNPHNEDGKHDQVGGQREFDEVVDKSSHGDALLGEAPFIY